jgi:hypothetical protein
MKRLIILFSIVLFSMVVMAQKPVENKWAELEFLHNSRKINLVIDYSEADIVGEDYEDFVAGEPDWKTSEPEIRSKFIRAFNEEADDGSYPHRVGTYPDAQYNMIINVKKVGDRGSNVKGVMRITNAEGEVLFIHSVEGNEGRFGSVCNLMGDAFREMGEDLGQRFYHNARIRKVKSSRKLFGK